MKKQYRKPEIEQIPLLTTDSILEASGPTSGGVGQEGDHGQSKIDEGEWGW